MDKNSVAAGIYGMWQRRLLANVRDVMVPAAAREALGQNFLSVKRVIDWLYAPDGRFGADPIGGTRRAGRRSSLDEAVAELTKRFGADPAKWQWGRRPTTTRSSVTPCRTP